MTKFAKVVVVVGILALVPIVAFVHWVVMPKILGGLENDLVDTIVVTALIYAAAGVVIVAPAWVITQVLMLVLQHAIVQAFTPKYKR